MVIQPARAEGVLTEEELTSLFSVMENLYTINRELLCRLEEAMATYDDEKTIIGNVFLELVAIRVNVTLSKCTLGTLFQVLFQLL